MNTPPILPQQQREHPEPTERSRPVPWAMLMLVALMTAAGAAYIAADATDAPASFGDRRDLAELRGKANTPVPGAVADGAALYAARCAACHQATGAGVPGAFPPLAGSEWAAGDAKRLAALVLHGVTGPITVKGDPYNGAMPAFGAQLDDAELAAVLTHVRSKWGGGAGAMDADTIAKVRAATQGRTTPFNGEAELKGFE
jgi:mono/diheme cytochrome c family protein